MKSTGIVRKVDGVGRIVFPAELRRVMEFNPGDKIEIFTDGKRIVLQKYEPSNEKEEVSKMLEKLAAVAKSQRTVDTLMRAINLIK